MILFITGSYWIRIDGKFFSWRKIEKLYSLVVEFLHKNRHFSLIVLYVLPLKLQPVFILQ